MIPVGSFSKLLLDVPDAKLEPLRYHEIYTKSRCVVGTFPLMLMLILSEVVKGRTPLLGVALI